MNYRISVNVCTSQQYFKEEESQSHLRSEYRKEIEKLFMLNSIHFISAAAERVHA